ncbi:MAG: type II 3-dehydroquinate dehydratase [Chitinophagaceae bacterium]
MNIHIVNGPNLNLLGKREPDIYGKVSFKEYFDTLKKKYTSTHLSYFQSNEEGKLLDYIQQIGFDSDGIILNAAAYTHTSFALRDAISAISTPVVEVHISNIYSREVFRQQSYISAVCKGSICGFGLVGYEMALSFFIEYKK